MRAFTRRVWFPSGGTDLLRMGHLQLRLNGAQDCLRWWKIKSADPSQSASLWVTLTVTAGGQEGGRRSGERGGVQVVRPDEVSIYLVLQWRRRDLLGFGCHPVTRCTFFPCIMGPDDSGWELPVNNLEVMSFIELHIVLNLRLKPHGRKYKKQYTSRVPGEAWTEAEETHPARLTGDNVKIRTRRKVLDSRNTYESPVSADPGRHSFT